MVSPSGAITPDSRWSWLICFGNMVACSSIVGICRCLGVFYPAMMEEFDAEYAKVSLISGMRTGIMSIGSLFVVAVKWFGYRKVGTIASFLFSLSLFAASWSSSTVLLILWCGAFAGFMSGISVNLAFLTFSAYFKNHRSKAAGLTAAAQSIGVLVAAPTLAALIEEFGWRGAMLISSAVSLHATVGMSLYRPVIKYDSANKIEEKNDESKLPTSFSTSFKSVFDYTLFSRPIYILTYASSMSYWPALFGCTFLIIPHGMETLALSRNDASILLTAQYGGDLVGQLLSGMMGDIKKIDRMLLLITSSALSILVTYGITLCEGFPSLCVTAFILGVTYAPFASLYIVLYSEVFSSDKMTHAISYDGFLGTSLSLPSTYIIGRMIDVTGSVKVPYYICGCMMVICAICLLGIYLLKRSSGHR